VEKLATVVASITGAIRVPLSVDVEGGYTDEPKKIAEKLKPIIEAGAVGINIEDGGGAPDLLVLKIEQVRKTADSVGVKLFINARTDVYLNDLEILASLQTAAWAIPSSRVCSSNKHSVTRAVLEIHGLWRSGLPTTRMFQATP
jgi:2-methylisocitrate lyase-like PEP mutase family enzyme